MAIMLIGTIGEDDCTALAVREGLEQTDEAVDIYIDSPGGDVIEANGISLALAEYALKHPEKTYTCTVGSLCASAAANILAKLPSCYKISVFKDSLIMYHSCSGVVEGNPQQLKDFGLMMELVNEAVIRELATKTTLPMLDIKAAFESGRELWLDGAKAVEVGLADEVLDATPTQVEFKDATTTRQVLELVAEYKHKQSEEKSMDEEKIEKIVEEVVEEPAPVAEDELEKKEIAEEVAEELTEPAPEEIDYVAECEKLKAENEELLKELEALKALVAKYQPVAKATTKTVKASWMQMVRELNAQHLSEQAYAKAYKQLKADHKPEFEAFMRDKSIR